MVPKPVLSFQRAHCSCLCRKSHFEYWSEVSEHQFLPTDESCVNHIYEHFFTWSTAMIIDWPRRHYGTLGETQGSHDEVVCCCSQRCLTDKGDWEQSLYTIQSRNGWSSSSPVSDAFNPKRSSELISENSDKNYRESFGKLKWHLYHLPTALTHFWPTASLPITLTCMDVLWVLHQLLFSVLQVNAW